MAKESLATTWRERFKTSESELARTNEYRRAETEARIKAQREALEAKGEADKARTAV